MSTMSAIRRIIQLVCFLKQHFYQVLDSLVVRISACHVEGPGSIPGRGGKFFPHFWHTSIKFNKLDKNVVGS